MFPTSQGIPGLPDLTHPQTLMRLGSQVLSSFLTLTMLALALGLVVALLSLALHRTEPEQAIFTGEWAVRYSALLRAFQHGFLVLILLISGFFLCSTLGNRYHNWEQARVAQVAATVAGDRMEQTAPQVRYLIQEPYTYTVQIDNRLVQREEKREVPRFLALEGSEIQVTIDQAQNLQDRRNNYRIDFAADYRVRNSLAKAQDLFFEVAPPSGYSLLQNLRVEREGTRLQLANPGNYSFPMRLEPGAETSFRVTYQAQGAPRWVYNAGGQLLSNFRLTANANFPNADFASGIAPNGINSRGQGKAFTWVFQDNVSVSNPFGVFTATGPILNTGVLPRLLLLAPAVFLWWLLLLYLSLPLPLRNVAIAAGVFFACLLALTYLSRVVDAKLAWAGLSLVLLSLAWGLGARNRSASLAAVVCTLAGAVLPVLGLLVPYTGLTLSLAGLLSAVWLAVRNWYGLELGERIKLV
ncbi:hypothetical protein [Leptolyngbya sp. FACHB-261]|uniref:hypothetical protein n=1 Tax=Leptolyngbya sp. FACHB-261 TaxID=2692806 RepID=UPI00168774B0|nr:hypothetical protein [Leptolyngbya sp. FACHB-261]MBD2103657.1 hypothetical protein [Leptolyngbya sp. FACHB-261]